jgi:hypothetical protein
VRVRAIHKQKFDQSWLHPLFDRNVQRCQLGFQVDVVDTCSARQQEAHVFHILQLKVDLEDRLPGLLVLDVNLPHSQAKVHADVVEAINGGVEQRSPSIGLQLLQIDPTITHRLDGPLLLRANSFEEGRLLDE